MLLAATDGCAQLLRPSEGNTGSRFQSFLLAHYPWQEDEPEGLTKEEACEFLWHQARCPLIHRLGIRSAAGEAESARVAFGNIFALDDGRMTMLEQSVERLFSEPFVSRGDGRAVLWLETWYWGLRRAVEHCIDSADGGEAIVRWIESGEFDPVQSRGSGKRRRRDTVA